MRTSMNWQKTIRMTLLPALLLSALYACGGASNAVNNDPQPPADSEGAPALPTETVGPNGVSTVNWSNRPVQSSLVVGLEPFAIVPTVQGGVAPRLNSMAHTQGRLFVSDEFTGKVWEVTDGVVREWFDVGAAMLAATGRPLDLDVSINWHAGMRSIAFHPEFSSNGKFYTTVLERRPNDTSALAYLSDVTAPIRADGVLIEWTADPNTFAVDPNSYRQVLRVGTAFYDHTIKQIAFDPYATAGSANYGLLYIGHGDGSDKPATSGGGQNNDALGKILRINPLQSGSSPYSVPVTNPFVGNPAMIDEVYSLGHRNPHHLAFSSNGMLIVAEPGRDNVDEINIVAAGGNYGWSKREGTYVHLAHGGLLDGIAPLESDDANFGYTYPAAQYGHVAPRGAGFINRALGGGYAVENGSPLDGRYFYCEFAGGGELFFSTLSDLNTAVTRGSPSELTSATMYQAGIAFDHDNDPSTAALTPATMVDVVAMSPFYDSSQRADVRYGQGPDGTMYLMSKRNRTIYRVTNSMP